MYQKDNFLSPKYITSSILNLENYLDNKIIYENEFTFERIEKYEELILPTFFSYLMNEVTKTEILYFNNFIKMNYPNNESIQNLINQLEENKYISKNIICKYWLHIYSLETNFYKDVNEKLRVKKGDFYYPLIKMCYEMVKKGYLTPIINKKLYRGTKLGITEYEYINKFIKNKNNQEFPKLIVFSKCFLSFSENEIVAINFLENNLKNEQKIFMMFF
jgi:hypothetical protein